MKVIKKNFQITLVVMIMPFLAFSQDTNKYTLRLNLPLIDVPQNTSLPYTSPSMYQSLELSNDLYELSFFGIDKLGNKLFIPKTKPYSKWRKLSNHLFKYGLSLGFSKYGSELPIPLGVWAHEEFHRSVLGVNSISSKNGNWILDRWDGTVYGVSDSSLSYLKYTKPDQLLYSYVAGVQYEILLNEKTTLHDFYKKRTLAKNALLLYNAYYVYNYFKFSTSPFSDSAKVLSPKHENKNPIERDYAGADLTAWAYDMFNPSASFDSRDSFPGGEGVNRRIGFSDLSTEAEAYLKEQKKLSLLNFVNPAIFFINRIKIGNDFSFNFFAQYAPTHFGNDVALYIPIKCKKYDFLFNVHNYSGKKYTGYGIGLGIYNFDLYKRIEFDFSFNIWDQPKSFFDIKGKPGGAASLTIKYALFKNFVVYSSLVTKTKGWMIGSPYLENNHTSQIGIKYQIVK